MVTLDMGATADSYIAYVELFMDILTALIVVGSICRAIYVGMTCILGEQPIDDCVKKCKKIIIAAILSGRVPQIISIVAQAYGGS